MILQILNFWVEKFAFAPMSIMAPSTAFPPLMPIDLVVLILGNKVMVPSEFDESAKS